MKTFLTIALTFLAGNAGAVFRYEKTAWVCVEWGNPKHPQFSVITDSTTGAFFGNCIREVGFVQGGKVIWRKP